MAQDDFAIVVGIDDYEGFEPLEGAKNDAAAFRDWLVAKGGGDVPPGNIEYIAGSVAGSLYEPGTDILYKAFRPLVKKAVAIGGGRTGRRFYGFFAGHGFSDPNNMDSNALYTANAVPEVTPHVAATRCVEWFRRNSAFDEVVLIMDCCRSLSSLTAVVDPPFIQSRNTNRAAAVRRFYACATQWGYDSREVVVAGGVPRGVFTSALLEVLKKIPGNGDNAVMGQAVKNEIHTYMKRVAPDAPPFEIVVDSNADICLLVRPAPDAAPAPAPPAAPAAVFLADVHITLDPFQPGAKLRVTNGAGKIVEDRELQVGSVVLPLEPGLYKAEVAGTDRKKLIEVVGSAVQYSL